MPEETAISQIRTKALSASRRYVFLVGLYARSLMKPQPSAFADGSGRGFINMTQVQCRIVKKTSNALTGNRGIQVSDINVQTIRPGFADMTWLEDDMFLNTAIFPHNISYNSEGSDGFSTEVNGSDSGHEQRISNWDEPLMEYDVAYGVRTLDQLHDLKRFFRACRGKKNSFRFRDPMDYTSSFATGEEARAPDPISPYDQVIGTGDGTSTIFQLVKNYDYGDWPAVRTITKPVAGTVVIAVAGVPYPEGTYTVDDTTGKVTLASRAEETVGGTVTMTRVSTEIRTISWTDATVIEGLVVGDWVQIAGFDLLDNRVPESEAWVVTTINNETKQIGFSLINTGSDTSLGVNETKLGAIVQVTVIAAAPPNYEVTAGYEFHVPMRFDVDRIPTSLEAYGVGSASNIKLVEVRGV